MKISFHSSKLSASHFKHVLNNNNVPPYCPFFERVPDIHVKQLPFYSAKAAAIFPFSSLNYKVKKAAALKLTSL